MPQAARGRLRLAVVRQRYNPFGGAERFIERARPALERAGVDVTIIARRWAGTAGAAAFVRVDPFHVGGWWRDVSFARAARETWSRGGYDLVQSHERIAGCDIYRAGDGVHRRWLDLRAEDAGAFERLGIRLNPRHRFLCSEEARLFAHPRLRAVVCNSRMVRDEVARGFGVPDSKLHVIHNGVDLDYFNAGERLARRDAKRRALGIADDEIVVVFVGSGFARKGLDVLIEAAARATTRPRIVVVGRDRHASRFEALAGRLGLSGRVLFAGGTVDVRDWYAAADMLALPTRYDPFPNVVLEALAMDLPVIVSARCGAAEIVRDGENGHVVAAGDPDALAARIDVVAARRGAFTSLRATAEAHSFDVMAGRLVALYATLV